MTPPAFSQEWRRLFTQAHDLYERKQYDQGLTAVQKARASAEKARGKISREVAEILNLEALYFRAMKKHREAIGVCERLVETDRKLRTKYHVNVALDYECIGEMREKLGEYDQALAVYKQALDIRKSVLGSNDKTVKRLSETIAEAARAAGKNPQDILGETVEELPPETMPLEERQRTFIKKTCRELKGGKLSSKLDLAGRELLAEAAAAEIGFFYPDSTVIGIKPENLFKDDKILTLACHGSSRKSCPAYREDLENRIRKIALLKAVFNDEEWDARELYNQSLLTLTDFGGRVHTETREHCMKR